MTVIDFTASGLILLTLCFDLVFWQANSHNQLITAQFIASRCADFLLIGGAVFLNASGEDSTVGPLIILASISLRSSVLIIPHLIIPLVSDSPRMIRLAYLYFIVGGTGLFVLIAQDQLFAADFSIHCYRITLGVASGMAFSYGFFLGSWQAKSLCFTIGAQNLSLILLTAQYHLAGVALSSVALVIATVITFSPLKSAPISPRFLKFLAFTPGALAQKSGDRILDAIGNATSKIIWPLAIGIQVYPVRIFLGLARYLSRIIHNGSAQRPIFFLLILLGGSLLYLANL